MSVSHSLPGEAAAFGQQFQPTRHYAMPAPMTAFPIEAAIMDPVDLTEGEVGKLKELSEAELHAVRLESLRSILLTAVGAIAGYILSHLI